MCALNNILREAKKHGFIATLPTAGIERYRTDKKAQRLYTLAEIESVCASALTASKNGQQLSDFLRFLAYCGPREMEALRVQWRDVDRGLVCIGADGDSKNRRARHVDMKPKLRAHLEGMNSRRAPDSAWLFPSPQRGEHDRHADTFRESLKLARTAAKLEGFAFHACRHYFASACVMNGIDFKTIAHWLGHQDGGMLVATTYGHLAEGHSRKQAERVTFA